MENPNRSSFLKSLAVAFGDGLAFGMAVTLAKQGLSKSREEEMTDLGPLAERLRKVDDHIDHPQTIDKEALTKFSEGLDGRVIEKVIVALEARLTEHVGQVDRRLAEIDAQVALDLKAVDTHTAAQTNAVERAIQQLETQVRDYVSAAQQSSAAQIAGVDQKLSALQEALPAKFREIIEAVRQSMEARVALELTGVENRVKAGAVAPERLGELETKLHGEVESLAHKLTEELHGLAERQQSQTEPLQQALQQLESKLTTLREELPPKIRQIVEAVEASMDARISAGDREVAGRMSDLEQALAALREELPHAGEFRQAIDEDLRRHAEQVGALDQKLTVLQEELPPKIKAIVDAVRESLDARMAIELKNVEEQHAAQIRETEARVSAAQQEFRQQLAAESKTPALEQDLAKLQADLAAVGVRMDTGDRRLAEHLADMEQHAAQMSAGVTAELEAVQAHNRAQIEQLEARLAADIHALQARMGDRAPELDKALQYTSLLETRVLALEQKLQSSAEEAVERAAERVWQALEVRLQERAAQQPPPAIAPLMESITGLREKSTSAEQNVLDLIAGIGQLFEKPAHKAVRETPPPPAPEPVAAPVAAEPAPAASTPEHKEPKPPAPPQAVEPEPVVAAAEPAPPEHVEPEPELEPEPVAEAEPVKAQPAPGAEPQAETPAKVEAPAEAAAAVAVEPEPVAAAKPKLGPEIVPPPTEVFDETTEQKLDDKPSVILFKPKDGGRKWRIPFVSSFLMLAVAITWLEFM
jgi:DNA repair exonuclease SbcCD ATPase subunit